MTKLFAAIGAGAVLALVTVAIVLGLSYLSTSKDDPTIYEPTPSSETAYHADPTNPFGYSEEELAGE